MITARITGEDDIRYLLSELDGFDRDKAIRQGLRAAVGRFIRRGRSNLRARMGNPRGVTGNLLRAFTPRVKRRKPGALAGFSRPMGNHAHLVDRGTAVRRHPLSGSSGRMPANYFWTNAAESEGARAMQDVADGIRRAVQRINERRTS